MAQAVIMAGGQGERFWPMTHGTFPKYRIRLNGKDSLLQKTYKRLLTVYKRDCIYVVTTRPHLRLVREELPSMSVRNIIAEPMRNNTAAAIYLSCEILRKQYGRDETVSFFPADQLIRNVGEFGRTMRSAIRLAQSKDLLITVGIRPAFPATGYGYIECGDRIPGFSGAYSVKRFVEKPDLAKAKSYIRNRQFLWNAGIFIWRTGVFEEAINKCSPEFKNKFNIKNLSATYKKLPSLSIDYALMEKADNIAIHDTRMDWCDVGNWDVYFGKMPVGVTGNYVRGNTHDLGSSESMILNHTNDPLVTLGLKGLIIIKTSQGVLICQKGRAEEAALFFKKVNA